MDPCLAGFYNEMNLKKNHKFAGFKLSDDMTAVIIDDDMVAEKADTTCKDEDKVHFGKLKEMLKKDEPRYILYDFGCEARDGRTFKKIVFMYWCSNDCPIRKKMIYTSTKDNVMKCFQAAKSIQMNDMEDVDYDEVVKEAMKLF